MQYKSKRLKFAITFVFIIITLIVIWEICANSDLGIFLNIGTNLRGQWGLMPSLVVLTFTIAEILMFKRTERQTNMAQSTQLVILS